MCSSDLHGGLHCIALLLFPDAADHSATRAAWHRHVAAFSPDDYLALSQHAQALADGLSAKKLFAFLRLGQADSHLFARLLPRLQELVPSLSPSEQEALAQLLERVWEGHFPLLISTDDSAPTADAGEPDLAYGIGVLLLTLGQPQRAKTFFEASQQLYGDHPATTHNLQLCQQGLAAVDATVAG